MSMQAKFVRPTLNEALKTWTTLLGEKNLPPECVWIFDDNLCFEPDGTAPSGFRLGYQLNITPPPPEGLKVAFDYFAEFEAPVVFYRIGSSGGKSICMVLCDEWFAGKTERDGYAWRKEWLIGLRPGGPEEVARIEDPERWRKRILKNRPLHDLDFCMPLRAVHEILAHGRVLSTYEHYALRFLHAWRRVLP